MKFRRVVTFTRKLRFESSVISYGSQTIRGKQPINATFESSVVSYGSQTCFLVDVRPTEFESSVVSYGSQTVTKPPSGNPWV